MKLLICSLLTLTVLLISHLSQAADCTNMQLQTGQTNIDFTSNQNFQGTFTVKANTMPGGCDFFLTFDYGLATSYANRTLKMGLYSWPYQISKDSAGINILKNIWDASSNNDVISGTLAEGNNDRQVNVNYWAILNMANPWLRFGNYNDYMTVTLYRGNLSSYTYADSRLISLNFNAPKRVDVSMQSTGGTFVLGDLDEIMDFGNLTAGATKSATAILKYNAGYTLSVSSTYGGRLKHSTDDVFIPYAIRFNGSLVNLTTSPQQIYRVFGVSPTTGTTIPISVTIGTFGTVKSGSYSDQVQLTIETTE